MLCLYQFGHSRAGNKGLEPLHPGIKIQCLTNLANSQLLTKALKQEPLMIEGINQCDMS
ncbi:hypothetical protein FDH36_gp114 [Escherichia phage HP3]|uniref:hypothetical protein n=1 Tax=Escherichia phage HP3 TaxID=1965367 RepID=UPI001EF8CC09|nr:hypothetical protein FDH36_gp114 [Escherichia phage HP3]